MSERTPEPAPRKPDDGVRAPLREEGDFFDPFFPDDMDDDEDDGEF